MDPHHVGGGFSTSLKVADDCIVGLMHTMHLDLHARGEASFWRHHLSDRDIVAAVQALGRERYKEYLDDLGS